MIALVQCPFIRSMDLVVKVCIDTRGWGEEFVLFYQVLSVDFLGQQQLCNWLSFIKFSLPLPIEAEAPIPVRKGIFSQSFSQSGVSGKGPHIFNVQKPGDSPVLQPPAH